jgi:hypothetical protein
MILPCRRYPMLTEATVGLKFALPSMQTWIQDDLKTRPDESGFYNLLLFKTAC